MTMKMIRRFGMRALALAFLGAMLCPLPARAQDNSTTPPPPPPGGGRGMRGNQVDMLTKRLDLTPDQVTQVKAIDADARTQSQAVFADSSLSQDDKRSKMMSIRQASNAKIRAILTPDQQTKFDALQAEMKERMQNRQGGGAPPAPPQ
jgi:periplasmic protein CpxP/Spy